MVNGRWRVGGWTVDFDRGRLSRWRLLRIQRVQLDRRLLMVLKVLVRHAGASVSGEEIMRAVWPDRVVTRDSLTTAVYELRKRLGDASAAPQYIRTEARRGYRLIAPVRQRRGITTPVSVVTIFTLTTSAILSSIISVLALRAASEPGPAQVVVAPLTDLSADPELLPPSLALESTLTSALVRMNPRLIADHSEPPEVAKASLVLQPQLVLCDTGPVLVVRLQDAGTRLYVWSRAYPLYEEPAAPSLVEQVASDVTAELHRT